MDTYHKLLRILYRSHVVVFQHCPILCEWLSGWSRLQLMIQRESSEQSKLGNECHAKQVKRNAAARIEVRLLKTEVHHENYTAT